MFSSNQFGGRDGDADDKKPAAKPVAKPAVKKPAAKPVAKPAVKKPAAKPVKGDPKKGGSTVPKINTAKLPKGEFGQPGKRKYPMPDKSHAANAKARAAQQEAKGKISKGQEKKIDAKADKVIGKGKK